MVLIQPTARALSLYEKLMETSRTTVASVVNELSAAEMPRIEHALAELLNAAGQVLARADKPQPSNGLPALR